MFLVNWDNSLNVMDFVSQWQCILMLQDPSQPLLAMHIYN